MESKDIPSSLYNLLLERLINNGFSLVERARLDKAISEIQLSLSGITDHERLKLGKLLEADRLILVDKLEMESSENKSQKLSFFVRCVDTLNGQILWIEKVDTEFIAGAYDTPPRIKTILIERSVSNLIRRLKENGEI
ncbi:CsgG/HfaB family protein [Leptospira neocaledonica]|nr:CsgG/HfaB family protein [Leptospira neocaledonica]